MQTFTKISILAPYLLRGQSPFSEAKRFSASQEIPHILWNPKVRDSIQKGLSQLDSVHTPTSLYLKIHLYIILPSASGSYK